LKLTLLTFATLGFTGLYLLARRVFLLRRPAALLGATLFLFNGLFASRLIIGHLTFHAFMLAPLIFFFLQRPAAPGLIGRRWRFGLDVSCAGALIAYLASTSLAHTLFPVLLCAAIVALLQMILEPASFALRRYAARLALAGILASSICAAKLTSVHAYIELFPRSLYRLPGIPSLTSLLEVVLRALFWSPPHELVNSVAVDATWNLGRHELEYGITFIPLLIVLTGGGIALARVDWRERIGRLEPSQWIAIAVASALFSLPIALNFYAPVWNALMKTIPLIGASVTLFRWLCIYVPLFILIAILVLDRCPILRDHALYIALVGIVGTPLIIGLTDRTYYHEQLYDPAPILEAYARRSDGILTPVITRISVTRDSRGRDIETFGGDDALARGRSELLCYETLFGYDLENFPRGSLRGGPVRDLKSGEFNLKNPSCYVFPEENRCMPGDHFDAGDSERAESFVHYHGMPFEMPLRQRLANRLSPAAVACVATFWLATALRWICCRSRRWASPVDPSRG
jgi:hypothetical protein